MDSAYDDFGIDWSTCSGLEDHDGVSTEKYGTHVAHVDVLPEYGSRGCDIHSASSTQHEFISGSLPADAFSGYSVPLGQRHTDLEMAMGPYCDGYRSRIEGGEACNCITCTDLAVGPTCSTTRSPQYSSPHLSIHEPSPRSIIGTSSDCSDTGSCKHSSLCTWVGRRMASDAVSGLQSNRAQPRCEHQMRIDDFQHSTEDGFPQRLAERSWFPVGEPEGAEVIHGSNAPSIHTTNQSEALPVGELLDVYKPADDVARSLSHARVLTQERHKLSTKEKTLQTPGLTHTEECIRLQSYEHGACSTSSTFKMRYYIPNFYDWKSYGRSSNRSDLLIDTSCLLFGAIAGPPIQWVTLRSMHIGSNSSLDQKILQVLPVSAKLVAALESHQNVAMALMFSSTSMSVALLCKVAATTTGRRRSAVFICFWLAMVLGAFAWNTMGGSTTRFFPVFMPVATAIGASSGLLWQRH